MPRKAVEGGAARVALNMKTSPELRRQLEETARMSGRTLTQEVEYRVQRSFDQESYRADLIKVAEAMRRGAHDPE